MMVEEVVDHLRLLVEEVGVDHLLLKVGEVVVVVVEVVEVHLLQTLLVVVEVVGQFLKMVVEQEELFGWALLVVQSCWEEEGVLFHRLLEVEVVVQIVQVSFLVVEVELHLLVGVL